MKGEEGPTKNNNKKQNNECTQSEDLDQPRHLSSLIGVFPQGREREVLYFHTCVGSGHFLGFKFFEFQYFFIYSFFFFFLGGGGGGVQKNVYFFGYEDFVDIFGGHHKIRLYLGVISMHFSVFSLCQGQNGEYFLGLLKFQRL